MWIIGWGVISVLKSWKMMTQSWWTPLPSWCAHLDDTSCGVAEGLMQHRTEGGPSQPPARTGALGQEPRRSRIFMSTNQWVNLKADLAPGELWDDHVPGASTFTGANCSLCTSLKQRDTDIQTTKTVREVIWSQPVLGQSVIQQKIIIEVSSYFQFKH
jgi:hypothetical protein